MMFPPCAVVDCGACASRDIVQQRRNDTTRKSNQGYQGAVNERRKLRLGDDSLQKSEHCDRSAAIDREQAFDGFCVNLRASFDSFGFLPAAHFFGLGAGNTFTAARPRR